ncbi:hypothetical protein WICMUC_003421 [Wickerhamomyces mucosus]|uniref:DNA repair metallo-beta-lactamase domain-containing protein n=1 Tax=Wickerhamomyces mucosus TaxID=1378264 RepID=A0A9P8TCY9_9ASCO|nr:hypothetical protein WICMUC_003421 [Wickerhamomyces mucosus]
MYLIQSESKNVLITGDIRAEIWWVDSIVKNPFLFPYKTKMKSLDNVYLDTTYGYRNEPFIMMPKNSESLIKLITRLSEYPMDDDDLHFYFIDSTLGFEEVWSSVIPLFKDTIHVTETIRKTMNTILENDDSVIYTDKFRNCLKNGILKESNFHICGVHPHKFKTVKFNVMIRPLINIDRENFLKMNESPSIEELCIVGETSNGHEIFQRLIDRNEEKSRFYLRLKGSNKILNDTIYYFFSRHSSYDECLYFISQFNVKQVYPTTESSLSWANGFQISRHFGELLTSESHLYDKIAARTYGPAPIFEQKPNIIDLLTNSEYNGIELLTNYSKNSFSLNFKGQQKLNTAFGSEKMTTLQKDVNRNYVNARKDQHMLMGMNQFRLKKMHDENPSQFINKIQKKIQENYEDDCDDYYDQETLEYSFEIDVSPEKVLVDDYDAMNTSNENSGLFEKVVGVQTSDDECDFETTKQSDSLIILSENKSTVVEIEKLQENVTVESKKRKVDEMIKKFHTESAGADNLLRLNYDRVKEIQKSVQNDYKNGFFDFPLASLIDSSKSCK